MKALRTAGSSPHRNTVGWGLKRQHITAHLKLANTIATQHTHIHTKHTHTRNVCGERNVLKLYIQIIIIIMLVAAQL